ncbi:MAG: hypothetical protein JEZ06_23575 [Anaerolineaceae bacterium]|nr:hypothetical protein [Anaerolineaceae bacterium]
MDAKWFWEKFEDAKKFLNQYEFDNIVEVTVPKDILNHSSVRGPNWDTIGPAASFIDDGLDLFNEVIISIKKVW